MSFRILKFWTTYSPMPDGSLKGTDMVAYCPIGGAQRSVIIDAVARLGKIRPVAANSEDEAGKMANARWGIIKPAYDAWKAGHEAPVNGTPLGAWPGITQEQAEALRMLGIRTVEEIAEASDGIITQIKLPQAREMRENAKRFLAAADKQKVANEVAKVQSENAEMKDQLEELKRIIMEQQNELAVLTKPRRGRPPKGDQEEADAA